MKTLKYKILLWTLTGDKRKQLMHIYCLFIWALVWDYCTDGIDICKSLCVCVCLHKLSPLLCCSNRGQLESMLNFAYAIANSQSSDSERALLEGRIFSTGSEGEEGERGVCRCSVSRCVCVLNYPWVSDVLANWGELLLNVWLGHKSEGNFKLKYRRSWK